MKKKSKATTKQKPNISKTLSQDIQERDVEMKDTEKIPKVEEQTSQREDISKKPKQKIKKSQKSPERGRKDNKVPQKQEDEEMKDEEPRKSSTKEKKHHKKRKGSSISANTSTIQAIDLEARIMKEDSSQSRKRIKFPSFKGDDKNSKNQVCQICFQNVIYPGDIEEIMKDQAEAGELDDPNENDIQKFQNEIEAKLLYKLAYCTECFVPVHWNCLGEKQILTEFRKDGQNYHLFKCERCEAKTKAKCIACHLDTGFMKRCERMYTVNQDKQTQDTLYVHQICAMSFPQHFILVDDPSEMRFKVSSKIEDWPTHNQVGKKKSIDGCNFCESSAGLLMSCQHKGCTQQAHAYCIMNVLNSYYYVTNKGGEHETIDSEKKWIYQLFYEGQVPIIKVQCDQHGKMEYCKCHSQTDTGMVMCDACEIWFHYNCFKDQNLEAKYSLNAEDLKYLCNKCKGWKEHLQTKLLDIILKKKSFSELVNEDLTQWEFGSLLLPEKHLQPETRIFEQIIYAKAWFALARHMNKKRWNIKLGEDLIKDDSITFINLNWFKKKVEKKIQEGKDIIKSKVLPLMESLDSLKDLIDDDLQPIPENEQYNNQIVKQISDIQKVVRKEAKLITDDITKLKSIKAQHEILKKVKTLVTNDQKPTIEGVKTLIDEMDAQHMQDFNSYKILKKLSSEYSNWESEVLARLKIGFYDGNKLKEALDTLTNRKAGVPLVEARHDLLNSIFQQKVPISEMTGLLEQGRSLKLLVDDEISRLEGNIEEVIKWEAEAMKIIKMKDNPVGKMYSHLAQGAVLHFKSEKIATLLAEWYHSSIWQAKAQSLCTDDKNEVKSQFVWTLDSANQVLAECENIYCDQTMIKAVKDKIKYIEACKNALKEILADEHDIKKIRAFLHKTKDIDNFDLSYEILKAEEKLQLMDRMNEVLENKQKIIPFEKIESLHSQIQLASDSKTQQHPIGMPWDKAILFQTKYQAVKAIQKEFQDVLNKNADTFNKQLATELKAILQKAKTEQQVEMKAEQKIIDSIPQSEEWFLTTFEKLKAIAGKALHQVDFKDFQQLESVIQDEKDCDQLMKTVAGHKSEQLVGAAKNLYRSLAGVKWLIEVRKLISSNKRDLHKILFLKQRATELDLDLSSDQGKNSQLFDQFKELTEVASEFDSKCGSYSKMLNTLDSYKDKLSELLEQSNVLEQRLYELQVSTQSGELDIMPKVRTYIQFSINYYELINNNDKQKMPQEQALALQAQAKEKQIPDEIPILKKLNESVARFEKFKKDYSDYKRFRERMKRQGSSIGTNQMDTKFTVDFLKRIIRESQAMEIETSSDFFDKETLESDLQLYDQWRMQADIVMGQLEANESALNNKDLKERFDALREQMKSLPVYDKVKFQKIQAFEWFFTALNMLDSTSGQEDALSLGTWEAMIKQADSFIGIIHDIKDHSIFQRLLWEVEQAKQVTEFVTQQKTTQKALAAKFNTDKLQNYAIFRNKHPKFKLQKFLDQARSSKLDLLEETRCLDSWIKDHDQITRMYEEGDLYKKLNFDRLKEITKQMYLSPIDYGELYFEIKGRIDTADAIKQNLKHILQEQEYLKENAKTVKAKNKYKRLRFNRIAYDLRTYHKDCNLKGIKEIDAMLEKVEKSKAKLDEVRAKLEQVKQIPEDNVSDIRVLLDEAKKLYSEVEIDLENEETDVKRELFEQDLKLILFQPTPKLQLDDFKELESQYEAVKNALKNEKVHGKFLEIKAQVSDFVRRIKNISNKEELDLLAQEVEKECPLVDFSQMIIDKDAMFVLGKRKERVDDVDMSLQAQKKRLKEDNKSSDLDEEESSDSDSSSSSESSSGSSDSSSSGSSSDSQESSSEESDEEKLINIAKNRQRRNVMPNYQSDFIYENSATAHLKHKPKEEMTEEEKLKEKKERKLKKKEKKREMKKREKERAKREKQIREHKESQAAKAATHTKKQKKGFKKFGDDQGPTLGGQIIQDKALQDSLQTMKTKIREQSRIKIKEHLELKDSVFSQLGKDQLKQIIVELENEIHQKHPDTDHFYRKRVSDTCENIRLLRDYKDVAELIAFKKTIPVTKLTQAHHAFAESVVKVQQKLNERKQQRGQPALPKILLQESSKSQQDDATAPKDQEFMPATRSGETQTMVKTLHEDSDDLESVDSNPAQFSDEEGDTEKHAPKESNEYDPYQPIQPSGEWGIGATDYGDRSMYNQPPQRIVQYNPYEVLESRNRFAQKKSAEPILYDPVKAKSGGKQGTANKEKNYAPPGSLLKVWEGSLEIAKDNSFSCQLFSLHDIQAFQALPELPHTLPLKGKAKISDVANHFLRLRRDKKLIKGWAVRKNPNFQDNNDKYTKLFDELDTTQKAALFNVFQGVTFYFIPITNKTKEFCRQMGIEPQHINQTENAFDIDSLLQEETHYFAYLSQIKQSFSSKINFLNPDILKLKEIIPESRTDQQANEQSFSPITSDEEENPRDQHKQQILSSVKSEDIPQPVVKVQDPEVYQRDIVMQDVSKPVQARVEDDEEDIDIDDLIMKFRSNEYDIQSIQEKLIPIIHKVKGEKEHKLTSFLQELIQNFNNVQQPAIKQEQPVDMRPQAHAGYQQKPHQSYGSSYVPQQQYPPQRFNQPQQQYMPYNQQYQQPPAQIRQPPASNAPMYGQPMQGQMPMQYPGQFPPQRQQFPPQAQGLYQQPGGIAPLRPPPVGQQIRPPGQQPPYGIPYYQPPQQNPHNK